MNSLLIAFGYKMRSGKDMAVEAIIKERGKEFDVRRYAFADALKREVTEAAREAGGMRPLFQNLREVGIKQQNGGSLLLPDWVQQEETADMRDPLCPFGKQRTLLQWWGTEYRRAQDPFYWVSKLNEQLEIDKPAIALIPDLRFPSEVSWVQSNRGFIIRVDRLGYKSTEHSAHESEEALSWLGEEEWNYIVQVQDGDLDELRRDAVFVFDHIKELLTPPDLRDIEKFHFVPGDLEETNSGN
jgi:hypothetical protein